MSQLSILARARAEEFRQHVRDTLKMFRTDPELCNKTVAQLETMVAHNTRYMEEERAKGFKWIGQEVANEAIALRIAELKKLSTNA